MRLKKSHKQLMIVSSLVVGSFLGVYFLFFGNVRLPQEFIVARQNAATVSQQIVDLTDLTSKKVEAINLEDFSRDIDGAVKLINEARASNGEAYNKTSELARHLEKLASSLEEIKSRSLQRSAYEAVAVELSLVSEFIVYTHTLNNFFDSLSRAIATDSFADRLVVETRLKEVNNQARKINNLNKEFLSKIGEFDDSL
ncbi:MAG: hypothetical protein AAB884_00335 [Patescibacteria group bacterium]